MIVTECFGYPEHRSCALPQECEETNVCILRRLRELGWSVERKETEGKG